MWVQMTLSYILLVSSVLNVVPYTQNFCGMYISRLSMEPGFLWLKFCEWRYSKCFHIFMPYHMAVVAIYKDCFKRDRQCSLPNSSCITVEPVLDLPVASLGNTVVCQSMVGLMTPPCLIKKIMCRCMRWHVVYGQL